ncbi:unnamed protein product [Amoebophrya sp. A120]|nr:unnamed protein product [Amoebophrya sp. A120]|eukprot:GSA120T00017680001.1
MNSNRNGSSPSKTKILEQVANGIPKENEPERLAKRIRQTLTTHASFTNSGKLTKPGSANSTGGGFRPKNGGNYTGMERRGTQKDNMPNTPIGKVKSNKSSSTPSGGSGNKKSGFGVTRMTSTSSYPTLLNSAGDSPRRTLSRTSSTKFDPSNDFSSFFGAGSSHSNSSSSRNNNFIDLPPLKLNKLSPLPWKITHQHDFMAKNQSTESLKQFLPDAKKHRLRVQNALLNKRIFDTQCRKVEQMQEKIMQWEREYVKRSASSLKRERSRSPRSMKGGGGASASPASSRSPLSPTSRASLLSPKAGADGKFAFAGIKRTNMTEGNPLAISLQEDLLHDKTNVQLKTNLVTTFWYMLTALTIPLDQMDSKHTQLREQKEEPVAMTEREEIAMALRVMLRKKRRQAIAWEAFIKDFQQPATMARFAEIQRPIALRARVMLRRKKAAAIFHCMKLWSEGGKFMITIRKFHGAMIKIQRFWRRSFEKLERHRQETAARWLEMEHEILLQELVAMHGGTVMPKKDHHHHHAKKDHKNKAEAAGGNASGGTTHTADKDFYQNNHNPTASVDLRSHAGLQNHGVSTSRRSKEKEHSTATTGAQGSKDKHNNTSKTTAAHHGGAATTGQRRRSVTHSKEKPHHAKGGRGGAGDHLDMDFSAHLHALEQPADVRMAFITQELRMKRYYLVPHLRGYAQQLEDWWGEIREWRAEREAYEVLGNAELKAPSVVWECPAWPCFHLPSDADLRDMIQRCRDGLPAMQFQVVTNTLNQADPWGDEDDVVVQRPGSAGTTTAAGSLAKSPAANARTSLSMAQATPAFLKASPNPRATIAGGRRGTTSSKGLVDDAGRNGSKMNNQNNTLLAALETPREAKLRGPMSHLIYNESKLTRLKKVVDITADAPTGAIEEALIPLQF